MSNFKAIAEKLYADLYPTSTVQSIKDSIQRLSILKVPTTNFVNLMKFVVGTFSMLSL